MAAPAWFVAELEALRRVPSSRAASARTLVEWTAQLGDSEAPSRPTVTRWLSGSTLPQDFRSLELLVRAVREHTRHPTRQTQQTLLRVGWWRDLYDRAVAESGRAVGAARPAPQVVYQGLSPFRRGDADRFFGRDSAVEALRERLDALHCSSGAEPLIVLGPSGAGKSSLLAAGLLPALEGHGLMSDPAVAGWPATVLTPGPDPMASLTEALAAASLSTVRSRPAAVDSERSTAEQVAPPGGVIVIIDQFEEIFQVERETRRRFLDALTGAAARLPSDDSGGGPRPLVATNGARQSSATSTMSGDAGALVILVCRNEFYPQLRQLPGLRAALDAPFNLDPLTTDELTEIITKPARRAGITVATELVNRVVSDAGVTSTGTLEGKLPLISHLLYVMNQAGPMTVHGYERAGGIDGAVAHTAEQAWRRLQHGGLEAAALSLLVQLVQVSEHPGHDTRRALDRHELLEFAGGGRAAPALEILAAARLITVDQDTVQITHDALLRAWQRLRDTIDTERSDLVLRQNIERRARQWDEGGCPPDQLFRGTVLAEAHRVTSVSARTAALSNRARAFLVAADEQERREGARRRRLQTTGIAAALVIVMVGAIAVVQSVRQYQISQRAILAEVIAQAKEVRARDVSLSAQLFLTAYRMQPTPELYTALLETQNRPLSRPLTGHAGRVRSVAYHGSTMISGGDDGTIRLWDDRSGSSPSEGAPATGVVVEPGAVTALAVVPGRPLLVSSRADAFPGQSALRIWDIADPHGPRPITTELPTGQREISALATSPDGTLLVATADDGTTQMWNIADPAAPAELGVRLPGASSDMYGSGIAISPDGAMLAAAGDDGTIQLWDIRVPAAPVALPSLPSGTKTTRAVAFSPKRGLLATAGGNGVLRMWDVMDPTKARLLAEPETEQGKAILTIAVSPDGNTIAAGDGDNTVTLWNSSDPTDVTRLGEPLTGHSRGVGKVAFSPDGRTLLTGGADATLRAWSLPATRLTTSPGLVVDVTFSHNGRTMAVGDVDNASVHLWDVTNANAPVETAPPLVHGPDRDAPGFNVAFSPDDSVLITGNGNVIRRWDVRDPRDPRPLGPELIVPSAVGNLGLSPDGRTLAVGGADGVTRLFRLADAATPPRSLDAALPSTPGELVLSTAFSPDGRVLAGAGADRKVWLWDLSNPARAQRLGPPLTGHTDRVFQVAFSPDGRWLASVGFDHTTRIWNVTDPGRAYQQGPPLIQQPNVLGSVAWTADGATLVTGSHEPSIGLWNMTDPRRPTTIGTPLSGHHTDYVTALGSAPAAPMVASGGKDHTVLLWNLDVRAAEQRLCATTSGVLTEDMWNAYVSPDVAYDPPCGTGEAATQSSSAAR